MSGVNEPSSLWRPTSMPAASTGKRVPSCVTSSAIGNFEHVAGVRRLVRLQQGFDKVAIDAAVVWHLHANDEHERVRRTFLDTRRNTGPQLDGLRQSKRGTAPAVHLHCLPDQRANVPFR